MISVADIERRRTADQLRAFLADVRTRVQMERSELMRARSGEGLYGKFANEVIPLSQFANLLYPPDTLFLPVLGNQGYDVEVFDGDGNSSDKTEIAKPHDGRADAVDSRLLNERGFGEMRIYDFGGQLDSLAPWIARTAANKSLKDYGDCTLVFVASMDEPFDAEVPLIAQRAEEFARRLGKMVFRARRAFLAVPSLNRCFPIEG